MIEEDALSLRHISYLYETSYYRVEIYEQDNHIWKSYSIQDKEYIEQIMPYLFSWKVHGCIHCNHLQLLFPHQRNTTMHELCKTIASLDQGIAYLQQLLLSLQQEQVEDSVAYMLCDKKNLSLCEDNKWNLYGSPRLEVLLRKTAIDECCWQHLCADILLDIKDRHYAHLPTPSIFASTIAQFQDSESLEIHRMISLLAQLKGCYDGLLPKEKRYKRLVHAIGIILLIVMMIMSIVFFIYEYRKAHQEYFNDIEQIGDVLVNPNE